jgi:hypothetical protein
MPIFWYRGELHGSLTIESNGSKKPQQMKGASDGQF